jgi:hypothetical protein
MSTLRETLKQSPTAKFVVNTARFLKAVRVYHSTGITPDYGYHSARHLYFATNKKAYSLYARIENFRHRSTKLNIQSPVGYLAICTPRG